MQHAVQTRARPDGLVVWVWRQNLGCAAHDAERGVWPCRRRPWMAVAVACGPRARHCAGSVAARRVRAPPCAALRLPWVRFMPPSHSLTGFSMARCAADSRATGRHARPPARSEVLASSLMSPRTCVAVGECCEVTTMTVSTGTHILHTREPWRWPFAGPLCARPRRRVAAPSRQRSSGARPWPWPTRRRACCS